MYDLEGGNWRQSVVKIDAGNAAPGTSQARPFSEEEINALRQGDLADQGSAKKPRRFGKIEVKLDDGVLRVEGVRQISERAPGLGGEFTYCTLGDAVELEKLLSGESLPAFEALNVDDAYLSWTMTLRTECRPAAVAEQRAASCLSRRSV